MPAVPGFRHDVFVSYAHSDNVAVAGTAVGFVSQLVSDLKAEVGRKVGKALDIWWDHYNLTGNTPVTPEIMAAASECATIVVVASPAYLKSEWCDRERSTFFQWLGRRQGGHTRAVFLVRLEPIVQEKLPDGLKDLPGYEFYRALEDGRTTRPLRTEFTSDKEPYYNRLSQLVQNVTDHLDSLLSAPPPQTSATGASPELRHLRRTPGHAFCSWRSPMISCSAGPSSRTTSNRPAWWCCPKSGIRAMTSRAIASRC